MDVQSVRELLRNGTLGTRGYPPKAREAPSFKNMEVDTPINVIFTIKQ